MQLLFTKPLPRIRSGGRDSGGRGRGRGGQSAASARSAGPTSSRQESGQVQDSSGSGHQVSLQARVFLSLQPSGLTRPSNTDNSNALSWKLQDRAVLPLQQNLVL